MNDSLDTPQVLPSEQQPKRPRYLPPEPKKSGWLSKPSKSPEPQNSQHINEPPALPISSNSLFSYKGRLGRLSLQASSLALILATCLLIFILSIVLVFSGLISNISSITNHPLSMGLGIFAIVAIPIIFMLVYTVFFYVRRLHDLDRSGWWLLLPIPLGIISATFVLSHMIGAGFVAGVIGLINGLFFLYLLLAPGTASINRYGAPRQTPSFEKVLGWISIALMAFAFSAGKMNLMSYFGHPHPTDTTLASTTNAATNAKFSAPYPFTAQQLWTNILKVTALPDGALNQTQIENAFGTKLHPDSNPITKDTNFKTTGGEDWYFSLNLSTLALLGSNSEIFFFDWKKHATTYGSMPPEGMCINVIEIAPNLLSQGWVAQKQDAVNQIESKMGYVKDNQSGLILSYDSDTKCLKQLSLVVPAKPT